MRREAIVNTQRVNRVILALSLTMTLLGIWIRHPTIAQAGGPSIDEQVKLAEKEAKDAEQDARGAEAQAKKAEEDAQKYEARAKKAEEDAQAARGAATKPGATDEAIRDYVQKLKYKDSAKDLAERARRDADYLRKQAQKAKEAAKKKRALADKLKAAAKLPPGKLMFGEVIDEMFRLRKQIEDAKKSGDEKKAKELQEQLDRILKQIEQFGSPELKDNLRKAGLLPGPFPRPGVTQPRIGTKAGMWPGTGTPAVPGQPRVLPSLPSTPAPPQVLAGGVMRTEQLSSIQPGFKHANIPGPDDSKNVPCTFRHQTRGELSSRYVGAADGSACPVKVLHEKNTQYRYAEPDRPPNAAPDWVHAKEDGLDYSTYVPPGFKHEKGGPSHSRYLFKVPPKVQPPPTLPPGTKHAKEPGPFFSKPVAESWFHANKHGPIPGQDLFSHYLPPNYKHETKGQLATAYLPGTVPPAVQKPTKHADKQGPQQSKHVPANYKHIAEGPDRSKYVPPDWKHMAEKGPDQSGYAPPNYEHVTKGKYKSHYEPPSIRRRYERIR